MALTWSRNIEWDVDDWRDNAACRDTDPDLFFPIGTTGPAIDQIDSAKAVCDNCDAQDACLEFALATNQESGIWGGTSEEERRKPAQVVAGPPAPGQLAPRESSVPAQPARTPLRARPRRPPQVTGSPGRRRD